jgi:hypothetical protein
MLEFGLDVMLLLIKLLQLINCVFYKLSLLLQFYLVVSGIVLDRAFVFTGFFCELLLESGNRLLELVDLSLMLNSLLVTLLFRVLNVTFSSRNVRLFFYSLFVLCLKLLDQVTIVR